MVGIVILNYNNAEDTKNCILSVVKYNSYPFKMIIVDNGSTKEGTVETIDSFLKENFSTSYTKIYEEEIATTDLDKFTFIISKYNSGYAQGNNKGLSLLYQDNSINDIMILNNDIIFIEDIIPTLIQMKSQLPNCGIISPLLLKKDGINIDYNCARELPKRRYEIIKHLLLEMPLFNLDGKTFILKKYPQKLNEPFLPIELPQGSCMLIDKKVAIKIKMFDPNTFLFCEENILEAQLKRYNLHSYLIPSIKCIHLGGQTMKKANFNTFIIKCGHESMNYYLKTYTNYSSLYIDFIKYSSAIALKLRILKQKIKRMF